jgi:hypothetical protein
LNRIYRTYRDRLAFYVVYIKEIHPSDGWQLPSNEVDGVVHRQHRSLDERVEVGQACMLALSLELPALVDEMDDAVAAAYGAMPERLYVIDRSGRVAYKGGLGPILFDPDEWERAIAHISSGRYEP